MNIISGKVYRPYDPFSFDDWDALSEYHRGGGIATAAGHHSAFSNGGTTHTAPFVSSMVEWKETADGHVLKLHLPGLNKEQVKVELEEGNILCISGEKCVEKEEKADYFYRVERSSGKFVKRFQLPEKAKADKMKAHMENGVLTITIPRKEKKMISNSKHIPIF